MPPLFAAILPKLVSGAFGILGASSARKQALQDRQTKFSDLRSSAEAGGFNPLTALLATGGAGFGEGPTSGIQALATANMFQDVIETAFDQQTDAGAVRRRQEDGQLAVKKAQLQSMGGELAQPGARAGLGLNTRNGQTQAHGAAVDIRGRPTDPRIAPGNSRSAIRLADYMAFDGTFQGDLTWDQRDFDLSASTVHEGPLVASFTLPNGDIVRRIRGEDPGEFAMNLATAAIPYVTENPVRAGLYAAGGAAAIGTGTVFATRGAVGTANLIQSAPSRLGRLATALRSGPAITANVRRLSTGGGPALPHVPLNSLFLN